MGRPKKQTHDDRRAFATLSRIPVHDVMSTDEVAIWLRCHQSTIYWMLKANTIPAFRIGSKWRYSRHVLEQWMEQLHEYNFPGPKGRRRRST